MTTMHVLIIVTLSLFAVFRLLWLPKDSTGKRSSSLAGIQISALFIFGVISLDTINDQPPQIIHKYEHTANSNSAVKPTTRKSTRRRQIRESTSGTNLKSRSIIKEKYYILGVVFLSFCLLYAFGHKGPIREAVIKLGMAIRKMNPYDHVIDERITDLLEKNFDDKDVRAFFLDALLAKQGKTKEDSSKNNKDDGPSDDDLVTGP